MFEVRNQGRLWTGIVLMYPLAAHSLKVNITAQVEHWTTLRGNTPQSSSSTATYHPSRKLWKFDEPDMRDTAEEVGTSSLVMYSCGWAKAGRPARTYIQQLCVDTGCSPENLPEAMDNRKGWRERVRDIRADGVTWWWWWWWLLSHNPAL